MRKGLSDRRERYVVYRVQSAKSFRIWFLRQPYQQLIGTESNHDKGFGGSLNSSWYTFVCGVPTAHAHCIGLGHCPRHGDSYINSVAFCVLASRCGSALFPARPRSRPHLHLHDSNASLSPSLLRTLPTCSFTNWNVSSATFAPWRLMSSGLKS